MPAVNCLRRKRGDLVSTTEGRGSHIIIDVFMGPVRFKPARSLRDCPHSLGGSTTLYRTTNMSVVFRPRPRRVCTSNFYSCISVGNLAARLYKGDHPVRFHNIRAIMLGLFRVMAPSHTCFKRGSTRRLTIVHHVIGSLGISAQVVNYPVVHRSSKLTGDSEGACLGNRRHRTTLILGHDLGTKGTLISTKRAHTYIVGSTVATRVRGRPLTGVSCISIISFSAVAPIRGLRNSVLMTVTMCVNGAELVSGFVIRG